MTMKSIIFISGFILLVIASCQKNSAFYTETQDGHISQDIMDDVVVSSSEDSVESFFYHWNFTYSNNAFHDLVKESPQTAQTRDWDPLDSTNRVMKTTMPAGVYRTEVRMSRKFNVGTEFWIGFRMLRPYGGHNGFVVNFQIGPRYYIADTSSAGSSGLHQLSTVRSADSSRIQTFGNGVPIASYKNYLDKINWGQWEKWVIHCRYQADSTGLLEVWKNDTLVFSHAGQNGMPGTMTSVKWGAYNGKEHPATAETIVYFDDITVASGEYGYADVAP